MRAPLPRLHLVTSDEIVGREDFAALAATLLEAGGPRVALHLRAHDAPDRLLRPLAERLAERAAAAGAALLVNGRVGLARAVGAMGVQLGSGATSVEDARRLLGGERLIGASVHSSEEAVRARGADYLLVGTLWATPSHPGRGGSGTGLLTALLPLGRPLVGIGGVTRERVEEVLDAGGYGVAVIRAVWDDGSPARALERLLAELPEPEVR